MQKLENMSKLLETAKVEGEKFYNKENKAAGTRLRGIMQEVKNLAQAIRVEVSEKKKGGF